MKTWSAKFFLDHFPTFPKYFRDTMRPWCSKRSRKMRKGKKNGLALKVLTLSSYLSTEKLTDAQPTFTCLLSTIETPKQRVKSFHSSQ